MNWFATLSLNRLRWLTILLPIAFVVALQSAHSGTLGSSVAAVSGHWIQVAISSVGIVIFATIVFIILDRMQQEIARQNEQLLDDQRRMAVLEERDRLAREMHDSLAQVLGYIHLGAQTTKRTLARQDVTRAEQELDDITSLAYEAYKDVREAILGLRETVSPAIGILGTLREYLQKFSRQAALLTELDVDEADALQFSPDVEVQLIRVIQEALTNVRKHASADRAWVRIRRRDGEVNVTIEDNGQGFDPAVVRANGHRFGVRIMQERVETVGGRFEIESSPGCGTNVHIYLPLAEARDHGSS